MAKQQIREFWCAAFCFRLVIVFTSTALGAALPLLLSELGVDPAHAGATIQVLLGCRVYSCNEVRSQNVACFWVGHCTKEVMIPLWWQLWLGISNFTGVRLMDVSGVALTCVLWLDSVQLLFTFSECSCWAGRLQLRLDRLSPVLFWDFRTRASYISCLSPFKSSWWCWVKGNLLCTWGFRCYKFSGFSSETSVRRPLWMLRRSQPRLRWLPRLLRLQTFMVFRPEMGENAIRLLLLEVLFLWRTWYIHCILLHWHVTNLVVGFRQRKARISGHTVPICFFPDSFGRGSFFK